MAALLTVGADLSRVMITANIPSGTTITETKVVAYGQGNDCKIEESASGIKIITPSGEKTLYDGTDNYTVSAFPDFGVVTSVNEDAVSYPYLLRESDKRIYGLTEDKNLKEIEFEGAGFHNSIYRGKNLGSEVTEAQWEAIKNGSFDGLYIGDYWLINDVHWRIAAFDYYLGVQDVVSGDRVETHHVVIVPDEILSNASMNDTRTIEGGYAYAAIRLNWDSGLPYCLTVIRAAFGEEFTHVLKFSQLYVSLISGQRPANTSRVTNESVWNMTEENVFGHKIISCKYDPDVDVGTESLSGFYGYRTYDSVQYPLFRLNRGLIRSTASYWLRDTGFDGTFCGVHTSNYGTLFYADSASVGVRPAFCLHGGDAA